MSKSKFIKLFGTGFVLLLIIASTTSSNRFFEIAKHIEIYASTYKVINDIYVDEVNPNHLLNTSVESMLSTLDPYTVYISEDKIEDYRTMSTGQYGGIGASTIRIKGKVFIASVVKDGPADEAGIEVGDEIISASGINVFNKSNEALNQLVRGQAKTALDLGVRKNGLETITNISVIRDKITINNVPYYGLQKNKVGYIKFTQFTENGGRNIEKAVKALKKEGATSIIIDLRGNLGGLLHEAVNICNLFIPKGKQVVETKGKRPENSTEFKTLNQPLDLNIPVAVLVNSSSASASEIVSGTLQDYDRAVIIGQKTYGKGLVQNVRSLTYNAQLKVTIAKYYTPSGRCIQALDYTHRNKDGSVGKIADSLKTIYYTQNKRPVYDGGGVDPDILLEKDKWSPLVIKLIQEGQIYLYANEFKLSHASIPSPEKFELSGQEFTNFINWVEKSDFEFKNSAQNKLDHLITTSVKAKTSDLYDKTLEELKHSVKSHLNQQLIVNSKSIKLILESEIALRYYNEEGEIETSLADDLEVIKAIEILTDTQRYTTILEKS